MTARTVARPLDVAELARWSAVLQAGPNTGSDQQAHDYFTAQFRLLAALPAILAALTASRLVLENHEAIRMQDASPHPGSPINVRHWLNVDRLAAAFGRKPGDDTETALAGLEQIMLARLGRTEAERDAALTELEGLRAALARCWALMDRSEGRVAEELYDILLPFEDTLAAREAEEESGG